MMSVVQHSQEEGAPMKAIIAALIEESQRETGQALAEYGLILAFVFAVCVLAVTALGLAIAGQLGSVTGAF
jgi:Flp pilus assembly pilin Flp